MCVYIKMLLGTRVCDKRLKGEFGEGIIYCGGKDKDPVYVFLALLQRFAWCVAGC